MSSPGSLRDELVRRIVRDAVGVEVVLGPRSTAPEVNCITHSVDTHPLLEPYRNQGAVAPRLTTYGHRPSSASRVFNPSTMGVTNRSQHDRKKHKPETLMTASVLRQILPEHNSRQKQAEQSAPERPVKPAAATATDDADEMIAYPEGEDIPRLADEDMEDGRPSWDDDFLVKPSANARYHLKSHVMVGDQKMTMREKLDRFAAKATAMEADTIYCKEKRELDRHFSRMQYDAAYRAAQEKEKAVEQQRLYKQQRQQHKQPSQEVTAIREIMRVRKERERVLDKRVETYVREQQMNAVPEVNYDGALFNAAFKKTIEHCAPSGAKFPDVLDPLQAPQQPPSRQSTLVPPDKQTKMCQVYSEEPRTIDAFTMRQRRTHGASTKPLESLSSAAGTAQQPETTNTSAQFLRYIESQPDVQSIVQQALHNA